MADAVRPGPPVGEQVALAGYTTLRLGGPARRLAEAASEAEIVAEVQAADERGEPLLVLGGGSNLVVADEGFPGTVVHVTSAGVRHGTAGHGSGPAGRGPVELTVAAGEDWDAVVAGCVGEGLAGLECLSGIPGRAGATPIQNVGAYGQEVAERIISVRVYDRARRAVIDLAGADCRDRQVRGPGRPVPARPGSSVSPGALPRARPRARRRRGWPGAACRRP